MRIVFMGSPYFAVPGLKALFQSVHEIVGVITVPDRRQGRGLKFSASSVKKTALDLGIDVFQPENLKSSDFLEKLRKLDGECFIVVGFRILPPEVYEMPLRGTINLHASLLPKYRGAAPIQWSLINGDKQTGVTTFFIEKRVDRGRIILQKSLEIRDSDTFGDLHDKLAFLGADLLVDTLNLIESGDVKTVEQKGKATKAPKIIPQMGEIDWRELSQKIFNLVRGLSPHPGVFTYFKGKRLKLFTPSVLNSHENKFAAGTVAEISEQGFDIYTGDGIIRFQEIQMEGKCKMKISEFLRGSRIIQGNILG